MHQFKINGKQAFDGDVWQWHQDYGTWLNDDQMPEARAMNVAIFLDEVNEFNGPLMFIPGSHKQGVLDAQHDTSTTSYPLWTINHEIIGKLVDNGGIVAPKGPAGSMILFHGCLVHASTSNLSPWNRVSVYLSLCAVSNHIRRFKRPGYIAHRDFTPIQCLPDDCLLKHYDVPLPWKNGTPAGGTEGRMNLYAKLLERKDNPLRIGLIGAGKFAAMYLAQVPKTPGVHLVGIADLAPDYAKAEPGARGLDAERMRDRSISLKSRTISRRTGRSWSRNPAIDIIIEATGNPPAAVEHALGRVPQRQARGHGDGGGRCVLRAAARAQGGGSRRGVQPGLRRPAGADLRPGGLGARRGLSGRGGGPRAQVAAALRAVDARDGVGPLRPHAGAGEGRRPEPEDVQLVPRRLEAGDRDQRGVQRHRPHAGAARACCIRRARSTRSRR